MNSLNSLKALFNQIATAHLQIQDFSWGPELVISSMQDAKFPLFHVIPQSASVQLNTVTHVLSLLVVDQVRGDDLQMHDDVSSDSQQILVDIKRLLEFTDIEWLSLTNNPNLTPIESAYSDKVTGWTMTLNIQVDLSLGVCDIPALPPWTCFDPTNPCSGGDGPQGPQGPAGSGGGGTGSGAQGPQGPIGFQGFTGFQGPLGFQGEIGSTGFGFQGPQGSVGVQGPVGGGGTGSGTQGLQGPQGFIGFQGDAGFQGFIGFQGDIGFQGNTGSDGFGFQGPQGSIGFQGPAGGGGTGSGSQGPQGLQGPQGFQGITGGGSPLGSFGITVDGNGGVISTGVKGYLTIPYNATITGWDIFGDQSGSCVIDIWKDSYGNFPPTVADTITGTEKPTLSSQQKNQDNNLTTWTTGLSAGDVLAFNVSSATTVTRVNLHVKVTKL